MNGECRSSGVAGILLAFIAGAAVGGGLALLAAPRSGEETRHRLTDMVDETREKIHEMTEEAEAQVRAAIEEGREALLEKRDMVKAAVDAGKKAMEEERAKHAKSS
ncbi:YtxH domain-containing protein [Geoalkalibacter halelectricus]|uniref:YtxH domain-containing protein n=1 Tax=Geoalkalibacter halelectricus TaxID=2847045 RepID=A0ABY5ZPM4_9BACT|nr:YtxH domain-containing protein [Geoalkalibacter halelectricus]MDO3379276.1 YtxH domain-containing protein [Geoalkalibacter halelectricus]UWZ81033.1 YtxH domain-containing protein [Geoalkalibacter halelectricus]